VILVVKDTPGTVDFLERGLRTQGFDVDSTLAGESGLARALEPDVALVVLDLTLAGLSSQEALRRLTNARSDLPVIVLAANGEVKDRIAGLDAGAVDYMVKPFAVTELGARIRAQLRRHKDRTPSTLRGGGVEVDLMAREVRVNCDRVRLSTTEFDLLVYLMRNAGNVLTREQIVRAVWGSRPERTSNVVDVYVRYLRRKLGTSTKTSPIETVRSVGYRFVGSI
jgi:DNA-binding response OmpR family regulator